MNIKAVFHQQLYMRGWKLQIETEYELLFEKMGAMSKILEQE